MKICFTLCSNNYLAQASLLAGSFLQHNQDYQFYIGLIDAKVTEVKYPKHSNLHVLAFDEIIDARQLGYMSSIYKIVELNTSAKPFYFAWFFSQFADCTVIYLDPDIYVYHPFSFIEKALEEYDFVITPHCLTPIPLDGKMPQERSFMKYGIYNLGFIAIRRSAESIAYIEWLKERLSVLCYSEVGLGVYVDQSWVNFLPIFFKKVLVSHHPGMNAAFWNLHERQFSVKEGVTYVNAAFPLLFFHFSSFRTGNWQQLAEGQTRYTTVSRPDVKHLFEKYAHAFIAARQQYNAAIQCVYTQRSWKQKIFYYWNRYQIRKKLAL
jgi:hypothetical protein